MASKVSGTGSMERMRMSSGRRWLTARRRESGGIWVIGVSKWATWALAWTPASVREEPTRLRSWQRTDLRAVARVPWMVGSWLLGRGRDFQVAEVVWNCQP